ncbi:MAG TPA: GNAT family N-acetyltransferase [Bacillota bacterium]|nr:GNAT family N-acetyltransferase [Bacillota bacterium]
MNPILFDFPNEFSSERLYIRLPKPGDAKVVYPAQMASMDKLKTWMEFAQKGQSEEELEVNIRNAHYQFMKRENMRLHVFLKETGEFVGCSGLHEINWEIPKFEIGYWIDSRMSGKGYMTEAVERIAEFAFIELGAKRVEIRCDAKNISSRAIPERLNFELEGILKNEGMSPDGKEPRDTCVYAKVSD